MRDCDILGFFLDVALNSLTRVDILLGTEIKSLAFIDLILALLCKNGTYLCDCVIAWLSGCVILRFL